MDTKEKNRQVGETAAKLQSFENTEVLIFGDACNFMGVSKSYLYKLTSCQKIQHYKPSGKLIYFKKEDLVNWMLRNRIQTADEILGKAKRFCSK